MRYLDRQLLPKDERIRVLTRRIVVPRVCGPMARAVSCGRSCTSSLPFRDSAADLELLIFRGSRLPGPANEQFFFVPLEPAPFPP